MERIALKFLPIPSNYDLSFTKHTGIDQNPVWFSDFQGMNTKELPDVLGVHPNGSRSASGIQVGPMQRKSTAQPPEEKRTFQDEPLVKTIGKP